VNTRQRFRAAMNFRPFDRLPVAEWADFFREYAPEAGRRSQRLEKGAGSRSDAGSRWA
jgi:hypothetical protein